MISVAFVLFAFQSYAQTDDYAKKLLNEVSKKYDAYKTIQSDFSFTAKQAEGDDYADSGVLFLNKPDNKYRIKLRSQDLISDGKAVWSISKETKEVQVSEVESNDNTIGPNNLFTFYQKGFKYISMDDERDGKDVLNVIELSPTDASANYFKIKLRINKNKHIHDVAIFDKSGAKYTYKINALYVNNDIPAGNFKFNKAAYSGYEVVDLR